MGANIPPIVLVIENGPSPGEIHPVERRPQTIGRGGSNDIVIPDNSLSRLHARVRIAPNGYVVEDLGSTNGTFINERRVTGPVPIMPGDTVRLGPTITLKIQLQSSVGSTDTMIPGLPTAANDLVGTGTPDQPVVPASVPAQGKPTYGPGAVIQPHRQNQGLWLGIGALVLIGTLIVGGGLGFLYYSRLPPPTPPSAVVQSDQTIAPTDTPTPVSTATATPTAQPTSTATVQAIQVPGLPAAGAKQQLAPAVITNRVDPFCQGQIEVTADEPVYVHWQRRLAAANGDTDYLAQWLEAAYYDLTLDGRPLSSLNFYPGEGPSLNWWQNLGLLSPGVHFLRIQWYTSRPISNGLDLEPADGRMDIFGPGSAGEGYCEIVVPKPVAAATASPTPAPTASPTPEPSPTATPTQVTVQVTVGPAPLGIFQDFERPSTWKRGDQPYGQFTRSSGQVHRGSYAGQLRYDFPTPDNDYVVFLQSRPLAGQPDAISAWVYGDGSGHFLNLWLRDAQGQSWGMSFGQINHTGWQEMTAFIDPSQPWPSGPISGPDNGVIDYPISFQALVLDDGNDTYRGQGTIYIDDLNSQEGVTTLPPGQLGGSTSGTGNSGLYVLKVGSNHRYEQPWGAARGGDVCQTYRDHSWDDEKPFYRGFNIELLLTNNSTSPVSDDWGENVNYVTANGKRSEFCYYGYDGAGPPPGGTSSVTFFALIDQGDHVRFVQTTINGHQITVCLDGSGAQASCQ